MMNSSYPKIAEDDLVQGNIKFVCVSFGLKNTRVLSMTYRQSKMYI